MIVTEKEAVDLRCCGPDGCGTIRLSDDERRTLKAGGNAVFLARTCVASKCMAWRWVDEFDETVSLAPDDFDARVKKNPNVMGWPMYHRGGDRTVLWPKPIPFEARPGYCGYARK